MFSKKLLIGLTLMSMATALNAQQNGKKFKYDGERYYSIEKGPELSLESIRLGYNYVDLSDGLDDVNNYSVLARMSLGEQWKLGAEVFYTDFYDQAIGGGAFAEYKIDGHWSLYGDLFLGSEGNDIPKHNWATGIVYDDKVSRVYRATYRNKRFRNNQSISLLSMDLVQYFTAQHEYFSVGQINITPEYLDQDSKTGYSASAHYSYGKIHDWRLGGEFLIGKSNYISVVDKITEVKQDIWGFSLEAGKFLKKDLELGVEYAYTDVESYHSHSILISATWLF
ncbi:hypothetical protein LNTAR_22559 [Lentisphaera araneosa HTCC2155]|uniref:Porin n=2 Tax=Lentisphaera TaxID=256846 RepID=A6DG66_9BACT|nr:hypothetical protein LNTAR_22374 [Lentisphaera araneosa HTCC2155]EDM29220.1 hypothetical protein LNTAR_22559 [Lentisphaera araneosa HTCC2155]